MRKPDPLLWIIAGIFLSLVLPAIGYFVSWFIFPGATLLSVPVHSLIETLGGLIAVAIAGILILERPRHPDSHYFLWMASALIGMGVLDLFHAGVPLGDRFVWLHSTATFVGGFLFACVWLPSRWVAGRIGGWIPMAVLIAALVFALVSCFETAIPAMFVSDGNFSPLAHGLNLGGGFCFLAAGFFFVRRFHRQGKNADWLFALHTMLFGVAGILFDFSIIWDAAWWWWHVLRLIAYAAAFVYAVSTYVNAEREVLLLNHELTSLNEQLDQTVEERTAELRSSEERYALAVRGSTDGLWDWNLTTDEVFYSPRFKELIGYRDDEFPNVFESFESHLHADDVGHVMEALKQHLNSGANYDVEYRLINKSKEYRWFWARGQAIWDESGKAVRMAGSITDITDQKLSRERFRSVIEAAPNAMIVVGGEGKIQLVNASTETMFGYSRNELIDQTVEMLVPNRYRTEHAVHRSGFLQQPTARRMGPGRELTGRRKDGSEFTVEIGLSPIHFDGQSVVLSSISDVTHRKLAEEALIEAKEAAEAANRAKSEFLANMSHEIRTPMNGIIGMTELVLETDVNPTQREYLNIVRESADSLLTIINQILDFSKIEAGRLELESLDFNLHEEVGDTLKILGHRAHAKGLELAWHIDQDVPKYLRGDAARLRQVLINLVGNAVKFTHQGEVVVHLRSRPLSESKVSLKCTVRDTGVGIPENRREHIFDAFEQADTSTTRKFGGTGLGLAISARIVQLMNGNIWVDSVVGQGTDFNFTVELTIGEVPPDQDRRCYPDVTDLAVVVVDDNATNRKILEETLKNWGMEVVTATGGPEAIEAIQQMLASRGTLPIVISDVHMPDMDGFMLARKLRTSDSLRGVSIILLTSGAHPGDANQCQQLGITTQLMKPTKHSELLDAIIKAAGLGREEGRADMDSSATDAMPPLRILLVEDGKANQVLAVAMLKKWGHVVDVAEDGIQGIVSWEKGAYDLILMDVQMPVMDGWTATKRIRELEAHPNHNKHRIPIVAMTAHAMKGDRQRCLDAGMDDYVAKPFRVQDLYAVLRRIATVTDPIGSDSEADSAGSTTTLIDWSQTLEFVANDASVLVDVAEAALQELPELLSTLEHSASTGDFATAMRSAHTIKSTTRILGARRVVDLAEQAETASSAKDTETLDRLTMQLRPVVDAILEEIKAYLANNLDR